MYNPFKIIEYQIYLLQLENYELGRYFKLLVKKGFWPKELQRKQLVWTAKAKGLAVMAIGLHILIGVGLFFLALSQPWFYFFMYLFLWVLFLPGYFLLFAAALGLLWPVDWLVKKVIIYKAKSKVSGLGETLKVIGIAGSYGKTTMKEVLAKVLSTKYKVVSTPDSVNTPVGIARWILKEVGNQTELLIVEMGEHYLGDVEEICKITRPDIAVVTGINEAHLERLKSLGNTTATVFEVVTFAKPAAAVFLNGDDQNVVKHFKEFVWPDMKVVQYQSANIKEQKFEPQALQWQGQAEGLGEIKINLLGHYALGDADAAIKVAEHLGLSAVEIQVGLKNISSINHRLQPIKSAGDILVIDDAYNGNSAGVTQAINVLALFEDRRKVFITPGLVETGKSAAVVHRAIGQQLALVADVVILIKNSVTGYIAEGIKENLQKQAVQVIWFETAAAAHLALPTILKPHDVVLFQNDWGDQYL